MYVTFGINTTRDTLNCFKIHSPLTARDREITSDNFEISPQIMPLPIQIPYKVPIYECTSVVFVHVQEKCCLLSQISRRDHAFVVKYFKSYF